MSKIKYKYEWETQDGRVLKADQFDDLHLLNTINFIERYGFARHEEELEACMSVSFQGEMAQYAQDSFINYSKPSDYYPKVYFELIKEKEKRNL